MNQTQRWTFLDKIDKSISCKPNSIFFSPSLQSALEKK